MEFKYGKWKDICYLIKKEFPHIRKYLWQEMFWSKSFCLLTTGGAPIEVIKKYIEEQGQKSK